MKQLTLIACLLFLTFCSFGQKKCKLSSLSKESKDELVAFWKTLRESVTKKDSVNLISICDFPFFISYEILSSNTLDRGKRFEFQSTNIIPYADLFFYEPHFRQALLQCDDPTKCLIFHGNLKKKHKTCGYVFCYMFKNKIGIDEERCFSIDRIDSSYKLTSHWIRQ